MRHFRGHLLGAVLTTCIAGTALANGARERDGALVVETKPERSSNDVSVTAVTHYLSLPGEAFLPGRPADYENSFGGGGACITSGTNAMAASINLPQGATITSFKVLFSDSSSTTDVSVSLKAHYPAGGYYYNLATLDSSGITGLGNKSTSAISYPSTVDNTQFSYLVRAYSSAWSCALRVMGVQIMYTTP